MPVQVREAGLYAMWISRIQPRWAALLTNKLYYSRDRDPARRRQPRLRRILTRTSTQAKVPPLARIPATGSSETDTPEPDKLVA
jgi:hypothetical protein